MSEGHSPLSQFEIQSLIPLPPLGGFNVDFTNSSLFMVIAVAVAFGFLYFGMRGRALVPGRWQSLVEMTYEFVAGMVRDNVGHEGKAYFPFIFTLFMFILCCNLLGMVPYTFTVTSHIIVTFALGALVFLGITVIGIIKHGPIAFITRFFPKGMPLGVAVLMGPMIYVAELISFMSRPISLSIRLMANMMAGHVMLKVIAGFVLTMGVAGVIPLGFLSILIGFEVFIAFLQAYIFTILTCIYLNDILHAH